MQEWACRHSPLSLRMRTLGPLRMANAFARPSRSPVHWLSTLISASLENFKRKSGNGQSKIDGVAKIASRKSELQADGMLPKPTPWIGWVPALIAWENVSGPAHNVDCRPPSIASDWIMRPCATSAGKLRRDQGWTCRCRLKPVTILSRPRVL